MATFWPYKFVFCYFIFRIWTFKLYWMTWFVSPHYCDIQLPSKDINVSFGNDWRETLKTLMNTRWQCSLLNVWSRGGVCGWDERMDARQLSVFHFISNRARRKHSSLLQLRTLSTRFFFKRLYDIYVTWFYWFLRREGDSAPH